MPGRLALKQLEQLIRKGEVDTVLTVFPDTFGRLMGKRVVGSYFLDHVADEGAHACIYLFTVDMEMEPLPGFKLTSWERGYGDMKVVPDLGTLRLLPWLPKTALVFCDVYTEEGEPIEEAPRWVLKRQVERAAAQGFVVKTAAELELYCFTESFEGARAKRYHNLTPVASYLEDYHILQTTKEEPLIRAIRNGMEGADVPVETSKGEWGRGQEEINLRYAEALEMADRAALYKHGAKEIAHLMGSAVTFMAKYDMGAAGSSFHLHSSLWDKTGRKALFATGAGAGTRGGSPLFGHWLAGQLAMARELAYFYAPGVNSYKRYQSGSFAPTIAAGLHGVASRLKAPKLYEGNAYEDSTLPQVPKTLREAIAELERSKVARAAFGDRVVDHYLHTAQLEQQAFDQAVTDWELMRNFERI